VAKIKAVLLDLDGTLRDTKELIYSSIERALKIRTGKDFNREEMEPYIHHHREVYKGLVGEEGLEEFDEVYTKFIRAEILSTKLFEGVNDLLHELHRSGYRLALVSSAREGEKYLRKHGIHEHFEVLIGAHDVTKLKPHPEPVELALRKLGVAGDEAVMVGDMTADMLSAKEAGVRYRIGITHGFGTAEQLEEAGATHIIARLAELPALLHSLI